MKDTRNKKENPPETTNYWWKDKKFQLSLNRLMLCP